MIKEIVINLLKTFVKVILIILAICVYALLISLPFYYSIASGKYIGYWWVVLFILSMAWCIALTVTVVRIVYITCNKEE